MSTTVVDYVQAQKRAERVSLFCVPPIFAAMLIAGWASSRTGAVTQMWIVVAVTFVVGLGSVGYMIRAMRRRDNVFISLARDAYGVSITPNQGYDLRMGKVTQVGQETWVCLYDHDTGEPTLQKVAG